MSGLLFAYGTLEAEAIMEMVTGARFMAEPAVLEGFARFLLRNRPYPGVVATGGARTEGTLYRGLRPPALARLDAFEDDCYERCLVRVRTAGGDLMAAWAYVIPDHYRHVVDSRPWDRESYLAKADADPRRQWAAFASSLPRGGKG